MYVLAGFGTLMRRVGRVKNFTGMPNSANTFFANPAHWCVK